MKSILKRLFILVAVINFSFIPSLNAEGICYNGDCMYYVITDDFGYSWFLYCEDGTSESGRTANTGLGEPPAEYVGNCEL